MIISGVSDFFARLNPTGGINKDAATVVISPHYHLHQKAANLSVEATIQYFDNLRVALNDEAVFGQLIGFDATSTISIMIDTTGSMSGSIAAVKAYAQQMVLNAANTTSKFFMTPFNDPEWGPVYSFTDPAQMVAYIGTLTATGGGDTPEKCYKALLDTVRAVPQGTNIYIFTDANSKDADLYPIIMDVANQKGLHITFMMSGENIGFADEKASDANLGLDVRSESAEKEKHVMRPFKPKGKKARKTSKLSTRDSPATTTIEDYRKLTIATDGQYILSQSNEISSATAIMTSTNWQTLSTLTNIQTPFNNTIFVDKTITQVEISFSSSSGYYLQNRLTVAITDANGNSVITTANRILNNFYAQIYRINVTSTASPWKLSVTGVSMPIAQVTIRAQSSLTTDLLLIDSLTQIPLSGLPLSSRAYDMYVICEDCTSISSVGILPCGSDSPATIPQTPKKAGSVNWWSIKNVVLPDSEENLICVTYTGEVAGNSTFKRTSQQKLSISALNLQAQLSPPSGQVFPNGNINVTFSVTNLGSENDYFTVTVTSSAGFAVTSLPNSIAVAINQTVTNYAIINANSSIGVISNIEAR